MLHSSQVRLSTLFLCYHCVLGYTLLVLIKLFLYYGVLYTDYIGSVYTFSIIYLLFGHMLLYVF